MCMIGGMRPFVNYWRSVKCAVKMLECLTLVGVESSGKNISDRVLGSS